MLNLCGICGFINDISSLIDKNKIIKKMADKLIHRGPDDEGFFVDENIAMGFRRLSIIDVNTGGQPIFNEDRTLVLTFNGEIYNFMFLKEELIKNGHEFYTNTDSEVIIHSYEEWGKECVKHLRGMFAFSIWNTRTKVLFLARDFFGIKPLFYSFISDENGNNSDIVYASEIKSILEFPNFDRKINLEMLDSYLSFQYPIPPNTFFENIYSLEAGTSMTIDFDKKVKIEKFFDPRLNPKENLSIKTLVEGINKVFEESVNLHKISDVDVGCFLSGGVDSSFVASFFEYQKSFTVGFGETGNYSEISKAQKISKKLKLEHHFKVISKDEYWDSLSYIIYMLDQPLADPSCVALYFVSKLASEHVKVVLSGEGADELFAGYPSYERPKVFKFYHLLTSQKIRNLFAKIVKKIPFEFKGKGFILRGQKKITESFIGNANIFTKEEKEKILNASFKNKLKYRKVTSPLDSVKKFYDKSKNVDDITKMQYIDINTWLVGDILFKADRMSMANSLELRVPFLDKGVFEVARVMPSKFKIFKSMTKFALRLAAKKRVPKNVSTEAKLGFPVPIRVWLREEKYFKVVKEKFESDNAKLFFNTDEIKNLLIKHFENKIDNSRKIWTIYVFILWYEIFFNEEKYKI